MLDWFECDVIISLVLFLHLYYFMNLSLCITTYNRFEFLPESFSQVINHPRISEVILMDDCSDQDIFNKIYALKDTHPKIKVFRQAKNRGMGRNKADAISYAQNEWCIIFDSDNVLTKEYVDSIPLELPSEKTIYQPSFAKPNFDFRKYAGESYRRFGVANVFIKQPIFNTMLNACNYVVNRDEYLRVYQDNPEQCGADTIWMAYLWLQAGNAFYVVPGMEYEHRVHSGSGFLQDADYNMKKAEEVRKLIQQS
jgi:glycosyltransferase involved in cell wall biosynthesis